MHPPRVVLAASLSVCAFACGESDAPPPTTAPDAAETADTSPPDVAPEVIGTLLAEAPVGPGGAVLEAPGVRLEVPAGALSESVVITLSVLPQESDPTALTPIYVFGPEGLQLERPVSLRIDAPGVEGFMLWSRPDGGYDVAGTFIDGVGLGGSHHFSHAHGSASCPATAGADPCSDSCHKDGSAPDSCSGLTPVPGAPPRPEFRQWCACAASDDPTEQLCATDPKVYAAGPCPARDVAHWPSADGHRYLGARNGEFCRGYGWRAAIVHLCYCRGTPKDQSEQDLCPIPWVPEAGGTGNEVCLSSLAWGDLPDQALPSPPQNDPVHPEYGMNDLKWSGALRTKSWVKEGFPPNGACQGYWQYAPDDELVAGKVSHCDVEETELDFKWDHLEGTAVDCQPVVWAPGVTPIFDPIATPTDILRGRLTFREWIDLRDQRYACNVPTPGYPPLSFTDQPERHVISTIVSPRTPSGDPIIGFNSTIRSKRAQALPAHCPQAIPYPAYLGIHGATDTGNHAEGDALKQLAALRGRTIAAVTPQNPLGYGSEPAGTSGCAEMFTDRAPCVNACADHGLELGRRIAGLTFLISKSPDGCRCYGEGLKDVGLLWGQPTALGHRGGRCVREDLTCDEWKDRTSTAQLCH